MNFDRKIAALSGEVNALNAKLDAFMSAYKAAEDFTRKFLAVCLEYGIDLVSIGTKTDRIPESVSFPFGVESSVFAEKREGDWPAIWRVAEKSGVYGGCGNHNQAQLNQTGQAMLINGVYEYKDGQWYRT